MADTESNTLFPFKKITQSMWSCVGSSDDHPVFGLFNAALNKQSRFSGLGLSGLLSCGTDKEKNRLNIWLIFLSCCRMNGNSPEFILKTPAQ